MLSQKAIVYGPNGPATYRNVRLGKNDEPQIELRSGETTSLTLDFSHYLPPGATVTGAAAVASNVTASVTISSDGQSLVVVLSNPTSIGSLAGVGQSTVGITVNFSTLEVYTERLTIYNKAPVAYAGDYW